MDERKSYGKGDLFTKLEEVSRSLENEVNGYLIGGLAMMYHGAKETTKDVDIVIDNDREILHFIRIIKRMGFERIRKVTDEYLDLKAHAIYVHGSGHMLDLFLRKVLNGFMVTEGMIKRSYQMDLDGNLNLRVLSPVDIFLFKSITMRDRDLLDMAFLAPMISSWTPFYEELKGIKNDYRLVSRSYNRIIDLSREHQIEIPLRRDLEETCKMALAKSVIHSLVQFNGKEKNKIFSLVDERDENGLEKAIEEMIDDGIIIEENGFISLVDNQEK